MDDLISKLSKIRNKYNCFDESEEPYYRALSTAIKKLSEQADGDTISRQAAIEKFEPWLKVVGYSEGELNMLKAVLYELRFLPSAQTEECTNKRTETHACDWEEMLVICDNCGHAIRVKRH